MADAVRLSRPVLPNLSVVRSQDNPLDSRAFDTIIPRWNSRERDHAGQNDVWCRHELSVTPTLNEGILTTVNDSPVLGTDPGPQSSSGGPDD